MSSSPLNVVGEKFLPSKCKPGTLSYCPTMDLIAVVTQADSPAASQKTNERLSVWRRNGQQVFTWDAPAILKILFLRWKMDGRLMAIGTSDGVVRLLNVMNGGKIVQCLAPKPSHPSSASKLSSMTWAINLGTVNNARRLLDKETGYIDLDDLLSLSGGKTGYSKPEADLPRELACGLEIETSVPKLSALPPGTGVTGPLGAGEASGDDDIFSSRPSIDAIFQAHNGASTRPFPSDEIDILVTGFIDGTVHIRIFECFDIGKVDLSSSLPGNHAENYRILQHISHPLSSTHALVIETSHGEDHRQLHLLALHLSFIPLTSPHYLAIVASKSTQLINLLRYLRLVSVHLSLELRGAFDLPKKFVKNINVTLAQSEEGPLDFMAVAYQLLVTGECGDELCDWMIDEIGERNLKRWEKASLHGMENIRRLVHECLLPAVERCQIVLSRLEGLSRFTKSAQVLGLTSQSLSRVMDTLECLNLLSHNLLKTVGQEIRQFSAFMKWLRLEVEIQGLYKENAGGIGSERLDELCARRDETDTRIVLEYLRLLMGDSEIGVFVRPSTDARGSSLCGQPYGWSHSQVGQGFYDVFKKLLKNTEGHAQRPHLDDFLTRLKSQAEVVFEEIAQNLRKSILHHPITRIQPDFDINCLRATLVPGSQGTEYDAFMAARQAGAHDQMLLQRIPLKRTNKGSLPTATAIAVPGGRTIKEIAFVDESDVMVLSSNEETAVLHSMNYTPGHSQWLERHCFDLGRGIGHPSDLEINGRKDMRVLCVLEGNRKFTVFDLDSGQTPDEAEDGGEDMDMD